jgi:hypothetical protein
LNRVPTRQPLRLASGGLLFVYSLYNNLQFIQTLLTIIYAASHLSRTNVCKVTRLTFHQLPKHNCTCQRPEPAIYANFAVTEAEIRQRDIFV